MQAEGKMNECRSLRCVDEQLSPEERARYARHLMLPEMGEEGQKKLKKSSVMVIGAGGLGSPTLLYLAAAGVGRIGIIDDDRVDIAAAITAATIIPRSPTGNSVPIKYANTRSEDIGTAAAKNVLPS